MTGFLSDSILSCGGKGFEPESPQVAQAGLKLIAYGQGCSPTLDPPPGLGLQGGPPHPANSFYCDKMQAQNNLLFFLVWKTHKELNK
jgi:hypothetical protein